MLCLLIVAVVLFIALSFIFYPIHENNEPKIKYQQVGGHVPVEIEPDNLDSNEIRIIITNLNTTIAKLPYAVVYYGRPTDVGIKTIILPFSFI